MIWRDIVLRAVFDNLLKDRQIESALDIGGGESEFKKLLNCKTYINMDFGGIYIDKYGIKERIKPENMKNPYKHTNDIKIDLNDFDMLPFENNSFSLVIMSQILEHLFYPEKVIEEAKRITKGLILVGLPNELDIIQRLRLLFGNSTMGYNRGGHHYMFNIEVAREFIETNFKDFKLVKIYYQRIVPTKKIPLLEYLAQNIPSLFAREMYYLLEKHK
ncbi:MAG: methyltransferase domain-containing protein [Candidatus Aenigmarchaeota archaeon]|nr:methyltransferase domain-containing protein [Candidatus Aenigmarchaeota archaeon]